MAAASNTRELAFNQDMLTAVSELYEISEEQAVERLARESEAAITLKQLQSLPINSYAGSWFDESSMKLNVAIADPDDLFYLKKFNVDPVHVSDSLIVLQDRLREATNRLGLEQDLASDVVKSYIDFKSNTATLTVKPLRADSIRAELDRVDLSGLIKIEEEEGFPELSTGSVRAADGTQNLTWYQSDGLVHPCSVGVSVEEGFITAGHCGQTTNDIGDSAGNLLGELLHSTWFSLFESTDSAIVRTSAGWTPSPQVNGYTDGIFPVSAEWAGLVEFPVGSTVCRYGQTSGGPHCGTKNQINVSVNFVIDSETGAKHLVTGLTELTGSCSDDGDSGGPHVASAGQIQGTNTGVIKFNLNDSCPTPAQYVYFQPIKYSIDHWNTFIGIDATMLTTHGSAAPQINQVKCPDLANSGSGTFNCLVTSVDSQGEIQLQWSTSTGSSSTSPSVFGVCSNWEMVSVTLQASNPYGTSSKNYSFLCPTGPTP